MKPRVPTEQAEAIALMQWVDLFPWRDLVVHHHNEHWSGKRTHGAIARAQGVRKGYPDYSVDRPAWGWHGLRVELKRQAFTASAVRADQRDTLERLREEGYLALVAGGWRLAGAIMRWYAEGPHTDEYRGTPLVPSAFQFDPPSVTATQPLGDWVNGTRRAFQFV